MKVTCFISTPGIISQAEMLAGGRNPPKLFPVISCIEHEWIIYDDTQYIDLFEKMGWWESDKFDALRKEMIKIFLEKNDWEWGDFYEFEISNIVTNSNK